MTKEELISLMAAIILSGRISYTDKDKEASIEHARKIHKMVLQHPDL